MRRYHLARAPRVKQRNFVFGENIRKIRYYLGVLVRKMDAQGRPEALTQDEFGVLLGIESKAIGRSTVAGWERRGHVPSGGCLGRICDICDVCDRTLLFGEIIALGLQTLEREADRNRLQRYLAQKAARSPRALRKRVASPRDRAQHQREANADFLARLRALYEQWSRSGDWHQLEELTQFVALLEKAEHLREHGYDVRLVGLGPTARLLIAGGKKG